MENRLVGNFRGHYLTLSGEQIVTYVSVYLIYEENNDGK